MKSILPVAAAIATVALAACGGSSSTNTFFPGGSSFVRIAHGSPDAGRVDIAIDSSIVRSNLAYATMTGYGGIGVGGHTMSVFPRGRDTGRALARTTFSTNSGQNTTIVLTGERFPTYRARPNLGLRVFAELPFNTPGGGAAVNYHHAAPAVLDALHLHEVSFGYSLDSSPGNNALGIARGFGSATGPQGLPSSALNVPITLYAKDYKAFRITPADAMPGCTGMPCSGGQSNLSLYLIDGPGASRRPTSDYPHYFKRHSKAEFIGVFDGNGLIQ
jgi:hypothetical protein